MDIKRQPEETLLDYRIRICSNKSLNSQTWQEVADLINTEEGTSFTESVFRKWWATFSEGQEYAIEKRAASEGNLDEFTLKKLELQKERNKLQSEKLELNKWIREQARSENIYEKIELAIEKLEPIKIPDIKVKLDNDKMKIKTAIIDIADAHYGREGKILGLHGETLAEYSVEIFERRMWELLERTVEICKKEDINSVVVINLGDVLDGILRLTQLQFLQMGITDSTMKFAEFMSQWLNTLSEYVGVDYYSILGNHAELRIGGIKSGELKHENIERLIPWYIKVRLKDNNNVKVHDAQFVQLIDVLGTKILATHGQDEKNLESSIKDFSMIYGEQIHMLKTGHLHHTHSKTVGMSGLQNVEYVQSPSLCGIDEYSVKLKKTSNAGSLITIIEEGYGKCCTYDIRLK